MAAFGNFCQKVFETNLNFRYVPTSKRSGKIKVMSILKVDMRKMSIFSDFVLLGT